jgi:hypothetical protein
MHVVKVLTLNAPGGHDGIFLTIAVLTIGVHQCLDVPAQYYPKISLVGWHRFKSLGLDALLVICLNKYASYFTRGVLKQ